MILLLQLAESKAPRMVTFYDFYASFVSSFRDMRGRHHHDIMLSSTWIQKSPKITINLSTYSIFALLNMRTSGVSGSWPEQPPTTVRIWHRLKGANLEKDQHSQAIALSTSWPASLLNTGLTLLAGCFIEGPKRAILPENSMDRTITRL
jgi:hypothetical protein